MQSVKIILVLILTAISTTTIMSNYLLGFYYGPGPLPRALSAWEHPQPVAILWDRYDFSTLEIEEVIAQGN